MSEREEENKTIRSAIIVVSSVQKCTITFTDQRIVYYYCFHFIIRRNVRNDIFILCIFESKVL